MTCKIAIKMCVYVRIVVQQDETTAGRRKLEIFMHIYSKYA